MIVTDKNDIRTILESSKTIAVVGLSADTNKDSNMVARYLIDAGYQIIPVNPSADSILGQKSYANLQDIPVKVDIVDVFRRPDAIDAIAEETIKIKAKVLWLQQGIRNDKAAEKASAAGISVIQDLCIKQAHNMLMP